MKSALSGLLLLCGSMAALADTPWLFVPTVHYVTHEPLHSVFVVNPDSNAIDREIPVDGEMEYSQVSADGTRVYITSKEAQQLLVIDATSAALEAVVDLEFAPGAIQLDDDAGEIYLADNSPPSVHVLDMDTLAEKRVLELIPGGGPFEILLLPDDDRLVVRQMGPCCGPTAPIFLYDTQTGEMIDDYSTGDINAYPSLDRDNGFLLTITLAGDLRAAIVTPNGFSELFDTELPITPSGMVADWHNWRLYVRSESELQVVDLWAMLSENPTGTGDVLLESIDLNITGTMSVDQDNNRLYIAEPLQISPVAPTPPFGEPPTDIPMEIHELVAAPLTLLESNDTGIIGGATSRGPFLAGEALPNAPAIPTLGPAGIGVLIVLMAGIAVRRYRSRAHIHSSMPPS